jgi:hypothetical protein
VREQGRATLRASRPNRTPLRSALPYPDHSADSPPVHVRFRLQPVAAQHNLSVPDATLEAMRIRTIDGPPLPAEIATHTALALSLNELHRADGRRISATGTGPPSEGRTRSRCESVWEVRPQSVLLEDVQTERRGPVVSDLVGDIALVDFADGEIEPVRQLQPVALGRSVG